MIQPVRERLAASLRTVSAVFANDDLRRLELGRIAATVSATGTAVVYVLLAYRAGEAEAVALLIVATTWTAAVAFPIASIVSDRLSRQRVIVGADVVRIVFLLGTAAVDADDSVLLVVLLAAVVTVIGTASSSARAALVPVLARDSTQLVGANAVAAMTSSVASLAGPAIAGAAVALHGPGLALAVFACSSVASALAALRIKHSRERVDVSSRPRLHAEAIAGVRTLWSGGVRVVFLLTAAQTLIGGVLAVLLVVAVIETLGFGETGPSFLAGAMYAGTLLGSVVLLFVGERRLAVGMAVGLTVWGVSAALIGMAPGAALGLVLVALVGLGDALADLSALTIVQRLIPNDVLARTLGVVRGIFYTLASIGSLVAPVVDDLVGVRVGLILAGVAMPIVTFALWPLLSDAAATPTSPARDLLASVPFFAPLPSPVLERVAAVAQPLRIETGDVVVREGDADRAFYVVADGRVEVEVGGRVVATNGAGGYFGEIAALRDSPRTATVRASAPTELYCIAAEDFLAALRSDEASYSGAERVAATRLARAV